MRGLQWINPIVWFRALSGFVGAWFVSLPWTKLGPAVPAILAMTAVVLISILTYASDPQWRLGLVRNQLGAAKRVGSNAEVALMARRLLNESPDDLGLRFEVAISSYDGENQEQATESLEVLAKQDKYGRAALWLLEKKYSPIEWATWDDKKKGDFGTLLKIAADDQPDNKAVTSIYADYLLVTGSQEKALGEITKLVSVQPGRALQGAMILRQTGRESQATTMARQGAEALKQRGDEEPENVDIALMRAQFALFLKRYGDAIDLLNRTAKLSKDERLRTGTAELLVLWSRDQDSIVNSTERFARQLSLLSKAVEIAPNHPLVINDIMTVTLQCSNESDPKVSQLRDLLVQGVAPELAHFIKGTAAMMRDDIDEASLHLELAAKSLKSVPAVLNNLAVALATRDDADYDRALQMVDAALEQMPNQAYFHETRGQILLKQGRYREAISSLEQALSAAPLRSQVHTGLKSAYQELGQLELAEQHARLAEQYAAKQDEEKAEVKVDFGSKEKAEEPQ